MKTDALPEIIEIIDDDVDPFGERSANTPIHDSGGPGGWDRSPGQRSSH